VRKAVSPLRSATAVQIFVVGAQGCGIVSQKEFRRAGCAFRVIRVFRGFLAGQSRLIFAHGTFAKGD
jgi:hypothetical protein